ncbi:hypothetical protein PFUM301598_14970 [Pseudomonas fluorescens]
MREAYTRQGLVPPIALRYQLLKTKEHYFPLNLKFRVKIGANHSWADK